jgi:hypothetical protein
MVQVSKLGAWPRVVELIVVLELELAWERPWLETWLWLKLWLELRVVPELWLLWVFCELWGPWEVLELGLVLGSEQALRRLRRLRRVSAKPGWRSRRLGFEGFADFVERLEWVAFAKCVEYLVLAGWAELSWGMGMEAPR